jgi:hypothetical protein
MFDRTTKLLLALIVLALWGLLLRPALSPLATHAQDTIVTQPFASQVVAPALTVNPGSNSLYLASTDGSVYLFDATTLQLRARAINTFHNESDKQAEQRARSFLTLPPE